MHRHAPADGDRDVFSVRDTGIGIAQEHRLRTLEGFYRAASTSETIPSGLGLGLALASRNTERHGAELVVGSEPGSGSCFVQSLNLGFDAPQVNEVLSTSCVESGRCGWLTASRTL